MLINYNRKSLYKAIINIDVKNQVSDRGKIFFHNESIKMSYRSRGKALRVQINITDNVTVFIISSKFIQLLLNTTEVINLINKIFIYSAIKIKANIDLLYSILNPDTNSDSPSVKSSGARCVSARIEIIQAILSGKNINIIQIY